MTHRPPYTLMDRETSWLGFSHRVLQEAADPSVPLLERLFFCGIFSSNLDEYFRVRVASLRSLLRLGRKDRGRLGINPHRLLYEIHRTVVDQQEHYGSVLRGLLAELGRAGIHIVDDTRLTDAQGDFVREFYRHRVADLVEPVFLDPALGSPFLKNRVVYLVTELWPRQVERISWQPSYALVEVPSPPLDRFVTLPSDEGQAVMFLDDVLRHNMDCIYPAHDVGRTYGVKLTRDAELYVEDEFDGDLVEAIRRSLGKRRTGLPSRFLYDMTAPYALVSFLQRCLALADQDLVLGGRYHNLHDFMGFPRFGRRDLAYPEWDEIPHPALDSAPSVLEAARRQDQVLHFPYQSFRHVIDFLDQAADDPDVEEVWLTVYRVARDSDVLTALVRAAEAGKRVTVFMEVQARFDERSNLDWAERLEAAGVRTLYSIPGLKVHAKLALVVRREAEVRRAYAYLGTGNFNEKTARVYADHGVITGDDRLTHEVGEVFRFLCGDTDAPGFEHLLVAPFTMRDGFYRLIEDEADSARAGAPSGMFLKMNALEDPEIIRRLYDASRAGVPIRILVRGICRLVPGVPGQSENIQVRSLLDRYLEHARIYVFHSRGSERTYMASADWMTRNLSRRVEVAFPILDVGVKSQLRTLLDLQWRDNTKARIVDDTGTNPYAARGDGEVPLRSQEAFRAFLAGRLGR